jgi:hypothetical protein
MAIHKVLSLEIQHVHVRLWKLTVFLVYQETEFGSNKIYTSTKNKKKKQFHFAQGGKKGA